MHPARFFIAISLVLLCSCAGHSPGTPSKSVSSDSLMVMGSTDSLPYDESDKQSVPEPGVQEDLVFKGDTLVVTQKAAVFVQPDSLRIDRIIKKIGADDFYVGADDAAYYLAEASRILDSLPLKIFTTESRYICFKSAAGTQLIDVDTLSFYWNVYFFEPGKTAANIDFMYAKQAYKDYFKSMP